MSKQVLTAATAAIKPRAQLAHEIAEGRKEVAQSTGRAYGAYQRQAALYNRYFGFAWYDTKETAGEQGAAVKAERTAFYAECDAASVSKDAGRQAWKRMRQTAKALKEGKAMSDAKANEARAIALYLVEELTAIRKRLDRNADEVDALPKAKQEAVLNAARHVTEALKALGVTMN